MTKSSFSLELENKSQLCPSWRFGMAVIGFMGSFCMFSMRVNMSLAIVCMVRDNITDNDTTSVNVNCPTDELNNTAQIRQGEFDWSRSLRGFILSSYFIGCIISQIPGGWLARRFGGKVVLLVGQLTLSAATLLIPVGARTHPYIVVALRVICGAASGVYFPAFYQIWSQWAPPSERTFLITLSLSGSNIGSVVTFSASGFLCERGFDGGWPSIFYIFGSTAVCWCVLFMICGSNAAVSHRFIGEKEQFYIQNHIENKDREKVGRHRSTPWRSILTSAPVWAAFTASVAFAWTSYTIMTSLPQYMKDVLNFDIRSNGVYNAAQYLSMFILTMVVAVFADWLLEKKLIRVTPLRKIIQTFGFLPPAIFCVVMGFLTCEQRTLGVVILCLTVAFTGCSRAGVYCNLAEIAPEYSGEVSGISQTFAMMAALISPLVASALTPQGTQEQWRNVFYLCAGLSLLGEVVYVLFASSEPQPWSLNNNTQSKDDTPEEKEKDVPVATESSNEKYIYKNEAYID